MNAFMTYVSSPIEGLRQEGELLVFLDAIDSTIQERKDYR